MKRPTPETTPVPSVRPARSRRAFTLAEIMVSLVIFGLLLGAIMSTFIAVHRAMLALSESVAVNASSRLLHERFLFDVRSIGRISTIVQMTGFDPTTGTTGSVSESFTCELVDMTSGARKNVRFSFDATQKRLVRTNVADGTSTTVMSGVELVRFKFFDRGSSGATATWTPTAVDMLRIDVLPQPRFQLLPGTNRNFTTAEVQLRNRLSSL